MHCINGTATLLFVLCALSTLSFGCDSHQKTQTAMPDTVEHLDTPPKIVKLPPPPGNPGPFLFRLEAFFPSQVYGAAATKDYVAIATQSDVRDIALCPQTQLPVCFVGSAWIAPKLNPNTPVRVPLYESDTQSGTRIDDIQSTDNAFFFAIQDGIYAGDALKQNLVMTDPTGLRSSTIDITIPKALCNQTALASLPDNSLILCQAIDRNDIKASHSVSCRRFNAKTSTLAPIVDIDTKSPVRTLTIAHGFDKTIAVWTSSAHAYAAFLDDPTVIADLGPATALRPSVAVGIDRFAVAWQGDDATYRIAAFDPNVAIKPEKSLVLNGVKNRTIGGLAAFSEGFAFAFRHHNTQQIAIIHPEFDSWFLADNSNSWRRFSQYGALNISDAHNGNIQWQTVESLIQKTTPL